MSLLSARDAASDENLNLLFGDANHVRGMLAETREAAERGHTEIVEALLADKRRNVGEFGAVFAVMSLKRGSVDPSAFDNWLIMCGARHGFVEVVRVLLKDKRVDPTANNSSAAENGHTETVRMLIEDGRADPARVVLFLVKSEEIKQMLIDETERRK